MVSKRANCESEFLPIPDPSQPFCEPNCKCCLETWSGHFLLPEKVFQPKENPSYDTTSISSTQAQVPTPVMQCIAKKTLLPVSEVTLWLEHLQTVDHNRLGRQYSHVQGNRREILPHWWTLIMTLRKYIPVECVKPCSKTLKKTCGLGVILAFEGIMRVVPIIDLDDEQYLMNFYMSVLQVISPDMRHFAHFWSIFHNRWGICRTF